MKIKRLFVLFVFISNSILTFFLSFNGSIVSSVSNSVCANPIIQCCSMITVIPVMIAGKVAYGTTDFASKAKNHKEPSNTNSSKSNDYSILFNASISENIKKSVMFIDAAVSCDILSRICLYEKRFPPDIGFMWCLMLLSVFIILYSHPPRGDVNSAYFMKLYIR